MIFLYFIQGSRTNFWRIVNLQVGTKVQFKADIYIIHWIYESGYCEIKNDDHIKLVALTELTPLD